MKFVINLSPTQADQLRDRARSLGVQPEELVHAAVTDLLSSLDDFRAIAENVLRDNQELYRRLA